MFASETGASTAVVDQSNNNTDEESHEEDDNIPKFSPERIEEFKAFVAGIIFQLLPQCLFYCFNVVVAGNVYERLVKSFAPSIWELSDVKRGALCMLFGGNLSSTRERLMKEKIKKLRYELWIL